MKRQLSSEGWGVQDMGGAVEVPHEAVVYCNFSKTGSSSQLSGNPADGRHEVLPMETAGRGFDDVWLIG